jgi:hypothetical protein
MCANDHTKAVEMLAGGAVPDRWCVASSSCVIAVGIELQFNPVRSRA